jgi:maleylpyruvate isomerase
MDRADIAVTLPWMGAGTEFVCRVVDALPDDVLRGPSALPGWSRAHVVAHLARNAEALCRLARWARTGEETPMYASPEARSADIEASAAHPIDQLRAELISTADELDATFAGLDLLAWRATVRNAQGRDIAAAELPWMRVREVWLHAVDLDAGARMEDVPGAVVDALLDDVTRALSAKDDCPAAELAPTDRDRTWPLGLGGGTTIHGTAAGLLGWLTGRATGAGLLAMQGELPTVPRWL